MRAGRVDGGVDGPHTVWAHRCGCVRRARCRVVRRAALGRANGAGCHFSPSLVSTAARLVCYLKVTHACRPACKPPKRSVIRVFRSPYRPSGQVMIITRSETYATGRSPARCRAAILGAGPCSLRFPRSAMRRQTPHPRKARAEQADRAFSPSARASGPPLAGPPTCRFHLGRTAHLSHRDRQAGRPGSFDPV